MGSRADFPDAEKFTSLLSLDVEKELGISYDKARLHGELESIFIVRYANN